MNNIDEIRRKRIQELQQRVSEAEAQEQMRREVEIKKRRILMQILTPEARSRLANLRLTKPDFVEQIELQLIQLAQLGRVQSKITDAQLKELLRKLAGKKRDIRITRK